MTTAREIKCLFAFCPAQAGPDGVAVLNFLIPEAGWNYMATGLCHEFNLTTVGIPLQVVIGRCRDHAHGMELFRAAGAVNEKSKDLRGVDLHIDAKPTKQ